jgi:hypothetical protein
LQASSFQKLLQKKKRSFLYLRSITKRVEVKGVEVKRVEVK